MSERMALVEMLQGGANLGGYSGESAQAGACAALEAARTARAKMTPADRTQFVDELRAVA